MRLLFALMLVSCTYDFDEYEPRAGVGDASVDTSVKDTAPIDTGPIDTGCVLDGGDMCYATAKTCSASCTTTRTSCEAACPNPGCKKNCADAERTCKNKCVTDCTSCTSALGCGTPTRCATEVG